jgi:hypothetical protein
MVQGEAYKLMTRIHQQLVFLLCKPRLRFQKLVECGLEIGLFHIGTGRFVQGTSRDALDPQLLVGMMESRPDLARYRHRIRAANTNHGIRVQTEPQSTGRLVHVQGTGTGMDRVQAHIDYYPFIIGCRICCCCCCRSNFGRRRKRPRNVLERIDHAKDQFALLRQLLFINIVSRWVVLDVSLGKERLALAVKDVEGMDAHAGLLSMGGVECRCGKKL